jgi:hypothetical protein
MALISRAKLKYDETFAACRGRPPWPTGAWLLAVEGESPTGPEELVHLFLARLPADDGL